MQKSYYFQHDYTAASDVKILFLRQQLGMEGYGLYWFIIEQLAIAGGMMPLKVIPVIAMQAQTQADKVNVIIRNYELFVINEQECFFSARLNAQIEHREKIKEISSMKGKKSGEIRAQKAQNEPRFNHGSTTAEQRKGKERKGNSISVSKDTLGMGEKSFLQNGELKKAYDELSGEIKTLPATDIYKSLKKFINDHRPYFPNPYMDAWNIIASKYSLPIAEHVTYDRQQKIKTRSKEAAFDFFKILDVVAKTKNYHGDNSSGWKIDFDYIISSEKKYIQIIEKG